MARDLSFLDEDSPKRDLSFLDESTAGRDLSFLDQPTDGRDLSFLDEPEDPSLGRIGAGLAAEIATAQGLKFAGAAAGAAAGGGIASIPLATIGYISGAITGGVAGSVLAQNVEGRDKISQGRVLADTLLNLIPVPIGKLKKGTTFTKGIG